MANGRGKEDENDAVDEDVEATRRKSSTKKENATTELGQRLGQPPGSE